MHHVEDKTVLLEHEEVDVLAANHLDRPADRVIGEYRRTLFREFNEQNPGRFGRDASGASEIAQPPNQAQNAAHQHSDPTIDELQLAGIEWRSHKVTVAVSRLAIGANHWQEGFLFSFFGLRHP